MRWCIACLFGRPVADRDTAPKHQCIHIFTQHGINYAFALEERAFRLGLTGRQVYGISKLLQQLLCEEFGYRGYVRASALITLEWWLVWAIENEDGMDGEGDEAE